MNRNQDNSAELLAAVQAARVTKSRLRITGSGSKSHLTGATRQTADASAETLLSTSHHRGIVSYRPEELVVTVRTGTPIRQLQQVLAENRQHLPFDPPQFGGAGTVGGAVACGLSGPGRPWQGSARDCLLGVEMINGLGERLSFGGQVMKNVAGYDVSRLQAGAFGTLGLLLEVSLKLLPAPAVERTLELEAGTAEAIAICRRLALKAFPVTGTCISDGCLFIRLSGAEAAVHRAATEIGGKLDESLHCWQKLRDHQHPFFSNKARLWRMVVAPAASWPVTDCLVEWGGSLRWYHGEMDATEQSRFTDGSGGFTQRFDHSYGEQRVLGDRDADRLYQRRLRKAFDPDGLFGW